jgi:hypothetical protein
MPMNKLAMKDFNKLNIVLFKKKECDNRCSNEIPTSWEVLVDIRKVLETNTTEVFLLLK